MVSPCFKKHSYLIKEHYPVKKNKAVVFLGNTRQAGIFQHRAEPEQATFHTIA